MSGLSTTWFTRPLAALVIWLLCLAGALIGLVWLLAAICGRSKRAHRIALAFDQAANAAFGGSEDMTISTRAALAELDGARWARALCWLLDQVDPGHCARCREDQP
jgi:hypothetical protein